MHGLFPTSRIFDYGWPFVYRCDNKREKDFLHSRIRKYVYSRRRGKFNLPSKYQNLVYEVRSLTKSQIRNKLFLVKPGSSLECELFQSTFEYANKLLTKCIWKTPSNSAESMARLVDTHRLAKKDVPRITRKLWPSFPSTSEVVTGMSRSGKTPSGLWTPRFRASHPVTPAIARALPAEATRMINNVIGIRSTVYVPAKFLSWFKLRDGILFLTVRYDLPIGLVRFLTSEWIKCPFNLWLKVPVRYKYYLRHQERSSETERIINLSDAEFDSETDSEEMGSLTSSDYMTLM